jgi:transcriptional regulator of acetoin/glycerol metabolism
LSDQAEIDVEDLDLPNANVSDRSKPPSAMPADIDEDTADDDDDDDGDDSGEAPEQPRQTLSAHLNDERTRIAEALAACNWNRVRAAEMLGMPRRTFYRRLKQYQLQ